MGSTLPRPPRPDHDVVIFDNVGIGHACGEPRDPIQGFAEGAIDFLEALGLTHVDTVRRLTNRTPS